MGNWLMYLLILLFASIVYGTEELVVLHDLGRYD